jgi:hypothetical protein
LVLFAAIPAAAHLTPPVSLATDRAAMSHLVPGAKRWSVRKVLLAPAERQAIQRESGWKPEDEPYRFYLGRDEDRREVGAVLFLTDFTIHGPVRIAVGLSPEGKVAGAEVVELSEEAYSPVKKLIDSGFLRGFAGRDAHGSFTAGGGTSMTEFYGRVIAGLVQRAVLIFEAGVLRRAPVK